MKRLAVTFALACASLALAGPASAQLRVGVVDDRPVGTPDGGAAFFALMNDVGLQELRISVAWDPAAPTTIEGQAAISNMLPVATLRGVNVVFSVAPKRPTSVTGTPNGAQQFASFLQTLAQAFPTAKDIIVGNEPNLSRFWQPQYDGRGRPVAGAAYEALLARSYDALKAVDPTINVIGLGLSPRGNDKPDARSNISQSPVKFLHGMGLAYRASHRTKPLMDEFAFHPYPQKDTDALTKGYGWPNAGVTNLDRIKQAFWDAFNGTAQKTFEQGLRVKLDEVGWQVAIVDSARGAYYGQESITPTDEATQAAIYSALLRYAACEPIVDSVLFFGFQDEANLDRWQAGLMRADGSHRPSYDSVKATIAETGGNCAGSMRSWRHSTAVDGAEATFPNLRRMPTRVDRWSFIATADEDALFDAGIYRAAGSGLGRRALSASGELDAYLTRYVRFRNRLAPGRYVFSIRFHAAMNPDRVERQTSRPFVVYGRR